MSFRSIEVQNMNKTFRLVFISLLAAQALLLYGIESLLPLPFIAPGAKLGLANLITVIALYTLPGKKDVLGVLFLRLLLSALFFGGLSAFIYSVAGATLSLLSMIAVKEIGRDKVSIIGVSAAGAVFHHIGQLLVASAIVENTALMLYLPLLSATGIGTGIFIGIAANFAVRHLEKLPVFRNVSAQ